MTTAAVLQHLQNHLRIRLTFCFPTRQWRTSNPWSPTLSDEQLILLRLEAGLGDSLATQQEPRRMEKSQGTYGDNIDPTESQDANVPQKTASLLKAESTTAR